MRGDAGIGVLVEARLLTRRMAAGLLVSVLLHAVTLSMLTPEKSSGQNFSVPRVLAHLQAPSPDVEAAIAEAAPAPAIADASQAPTVPPLASSDSSPSRAAMPEISRAVSRAIELPFTEIYFKSSELDEQPRPLLPVTPSYPPHARAQDVEGWVRLLLMVDETGEVRHVEVLEASVPAVFDEAAITAFRGLAFSPGRRGGKSVKSRMIVKVDFELEGDAKQ